MKIEIMERPKWISYSDIHELLYKAHEQNRENGLWVKTAGFTPEELEKHIGSEGKCFVAIDGKKPVGVMAVRLIDRNKWYAKNKVADQVLVGVLPEYTGRHISTALHEKVIEFAKKTGVGQIEVRTAYINKNMQKACIKWGFCYVDFFAAKDYTYYIVSLSKWLGKCPFPKIWIRIRYIMKKTLVKLIYKPGRIRRLG